MLTDYHMHTSFSDDSDYPMESAVQRSMALGLDEICFTEHVDYGVKTDDNCDYEQYLLEFSRCRDKYKGQIAIKLGIEFGIQTHTVDMFEQDAKRYPFDFIIFSCHQVEDKEFWTHDFQEGRTQQQYNERYYQEIYDVMQRYTSYSVLGHLDLLRRYDLPNDYPFAKVKDRVAAILECAIRQDKGLELNTSSVRYQVPDLTPGREIWQLYRDLGGRLITIGSDSHKQEHVGFHSKEGQQQLRALGFTEFCTFSHMEPIFHPLCE